MPSYQDLISGKVMVSQMRNVELDDLLGRDPVVLDRAACSSGSAAASYASSSSRKARSAAATLISDASRLAGCSSR